MAQELVTQDGEILASGGNVPGLPEGYGQTASLAVALSKAEVDQQITTARAYPRDIVRVVNEIMALATIDEETAKECIYALPRGDKPIRGPSIRLAEIIASQWGNCRDGSRIVHVDRIEMYVESEGVFHDLQTNRATTARVRRSIRTSKGRLFSEDMITVTGNAAASIAKRNAILGGVPKAAWRKAYASVEKVLAGDIKTLAERRDGAVKAFAAFGVKPEQICAALQIKSAEEITLDHIPTLIGMHSALKNGEETVERMFPKHAPAGEAPKGVEGKLDAIAGAAKPAADAQKPAGDAAAGAMRGSTEAQAAADEISGVTSRDGEPAQAAPEPAKTAAPDPSERAAAILGALGHTPTGIDKDDPAQVIAYAAGIEAAGKGQARRAIPGEYRTEARAAEASTWQLGHDYATAQKETK